MVSHNEKLFKELSKAYAKIDRLKARIADPFYRLRNKNTNEYMLGKPPAKKPPRVIVTADDIVIVEECIKEGTCFAPKMDEDEVLGGYQLTRHSRIKAAKGKKKKERQLKKEETKLGKTAVVKPPT